MHGNIEDEDTVHEPTIDLELQDNNNASERETYTMMEADTGVQNETKRDTPIF